MATRSRVKLKFIENRNARSATYRKRKEGLRKKMVEISALCEVDCCVILYNAELEGDYVWPSRERASELLVRLENYSSTMQTPKMVNHDEYMKVRIAKIRDEIEKEEAKNKRMEASILIHKITSEGMSVVRDSREAGLLSWFASEKLQEIQRHKRLFPPLEQELQQPAPPPPPTPAPQMPVESPIGVPDVLPETPIDFDLDGMLNAYKRCIDIGDVAGPSDTKDT